ncbi:uncharacterized protein VTP21DRAFT_3738 [Calcarisporiella thermophila]|uniref:uncharacterized protein n=1 Tax=Calcarisporiella thermophila TaxID=911321 RepID=UPI00374494C4
MSKSIAKDDLELGELHARTTKSASGISNTDIANLYLGIEEELHPTCSQSSRTPSTSAASTTDSKSVKKQEQNPNEQRKKRFLSLLLWWNTEDWWSCWIGFILLGCVVACVSHHIPEPKFLPWTANPFSSLATKGNYGLIALFPISTILLTLCLASLRSPSYRLFPFGFAVVWFLAMISKWLAAQKGIKSISLGDSVWAIVFGMVLRNVCVRGEVVPRWLKIAMQTELYISISLVLLCIDISVLKPLASRAIFVSWIDTPLLFPLMAYFVGYKWLRIDIQLAIIMAGASIICGSSAAVALAASLGTPTKAQMPIAIISVFTIPSLLAMPYVAKALRIPDEMAGAWFGGAVDSTGAVIASATIYGSKAAIDSAAVVKMMQNVLIGPISVGVAAFWTHVEKQRELAEEERILGNGETKPRKKSGIMDSLRSLWQRFPKFVLGFIMTAVIFNTAINPKHRAEVNEFCFTVGEWFSTCSFVSIGFGLQFFQLRRELRLMAALTTLYAITQISDILAGFGLCWAAFRKF